MEELTFKVCDHCHGKMLPQTMSQTFRFNGKEIEIKGIQGYRCESCGNEVYEAKEIRMIDKIIRAMNDKPAVDILNLDETADHLRVSNIRSQVGRNTPFNYGKIARKTHEKHTQVVSKL